MLHWLIHSDGGLLVRLSAGAFIFAVLALVDFQKNGRSATRWKEYSFLLIAVFVALTYGALNDQITCTISPEYFFYGKEIYKVIGDAWPPEMNALRWEAGKVGMKATWTAGLILGVVLLVSNNPRRGWPRLRNRELIRYLPVMVCFAAGFGIVGGVLGYEGYLTRLSADFVDMTRADVFRPRRFICTWGVHLGGYVGGVVGTVVASMMVIRRRKYERERELP